ncbi:FabD/lysophospholipase-like protein [Mollisia scopiformis]|uniref:Lysophospholipase n=1 Tax=Mollisia scopiformis TaxID=149040 RepID=A0A194XHT9_MOLSC|nr:FabD/lysophospholipase-like protein [Mollisia scopiformis]KUJ19701.1 FabD/lysophospholipase-like protein [Mollisia scopiformis]
MLENLRRRHQFESEETLKEPSPPADGSRGLFNSNHASNQRSKTDPKSFWNDVVKPAFPEAITDIGIIKSAITIQSNTKQDIHDQNRYPEVGHVAEVRRGLNLAPPEQRFLSDRKVKVRNAFANYLGLNPADVHPDDVPTVGFGGSGGGFRAMIGVLGYSEEMKRTGLWDALTYVAGVSGACWAFAAYYTFGEASMSRTIDNYKHRLSPHHPLSADAIRKLLTTHDGPYATLAPVAIKQHSGLHAVPMDYYSVFLTGYVFIHADHETGKDVAGHRHTWYKWSQAIEHLQGGKEPLHILTAIRHERPWKDWVDKDHAFEGDFAEDEKDEKDAWFQWFEMTPFEIGCDELQAWVPTWGFGRPFSEGRSTMQLPEQSLSLLLGLATGAPAGPLESYLATIKRALPQNFIGNLIEELASKVSKLWGKKGTEEFTNHHPLHASNEHNFLFHFSKLQPGQAYPPGLENSPQIHLVDGGMDNNCPTYVLLHPSREVDVILNMDASSDVQKDTFQERVDQIGYRRGLKFTRRTDLKPKEDTKDPDRFQGHYAQIYDGVLCERPATVKDSYGNTVTNPPAPVCHHESTMVYMPLLPNERAVPDFDPSTAKFSGSYNLVWTPEQIDMLVKVSMQNFHDGEQTIKQVLMEAYQRKKAIREGTWTGQVGQAPVYQHPQQGYSTSSFQQYQTQPPAQRPSGPPPGIGSQHQQQSYSPYSQPYNPSRPQETQLPMGLPQQLNVSQPPPRQYSTQPSVQNQGNQGNYQSYHPEVPPQSSQTHLPHYQQQGQSQQEQVQERIDPGQGGAQSGLSQAPRNQYNPADPKWQGR